MRVTLYGISSACPSGTDAGSGAGSKSPGEAVFLLDAGTLAWEEEFLTARVARRPVRCQGVPPAAAPPASSPS